MALFVNMAKHKGVSLLDAQDFEWDIAVVCEDTRKLYPEARYEAVSLIGERLYVMVFCIRGQVVRVISLRKANPREVKRYAAEN